MNIIETIKEGLRIARSSKSLWLYGFFVGLGATFDFSGKSPVPGGGATAHGVPHAFTAGAALLVIGSLVLVAVGGFMYFVSEGALIEGVTRARRGLPPTVREGWRDGVAHWGVLLRLTIIYLAISGGSLVLLSAPSLLALQLSGTALAVVLAVPAAVIAVPWLVTLYMWQAFACRIAVLENRRTRDAIAKARLFLHGRLLHGLKLIVAAILGRTLVLATGALGLVAGALIVFGVLWLLGMAHATVPVIALGTVGLLPMACILISISGTTQSSIWTIGYLTQEGQ